MWYQFIKSHYILLLLARMLIGFTCRIKCEHKLYERPPKTTYQTWLLPHANAKEKEFDVPKTIHVNKDACTVATAFHFPTQKLRHSYYKYSPSPSLLFRPIQNLNLTFFFFAEKSTNGVVWTSTTRWFQSRR